MSSSPQARPGTHPQALDSAAYLEQGAALLERLSDEHYVAALPPVFASTVGAHMRHILDHCDCLLDGLATGRVDYDERRRDRRLETDRTLALAAARDLIDRLRAVTDADLALDVRMDTGSDEPAWAGSSLTRELQFLTSHTIHHYALIAAILGHAGCEVAGDFGISPSTLRFQRR